MRMKSVLALSALSAATFLAGAAHAIPVKQLNKSAPAAQATQANPAAQPAQTTTAQTPAAQTEAAPQAKHHAHHRHHRHHRHHHRHHRHHHHHHFARHYHEVPSNNFLLGGELGYGIQKEKFSTGFNEPGLVGVGITQKGMTSRHTQTITDNGAMMGLLAGWQWRYRRYMLGVEGNVTFSDFQLGHQFAYTDEINFNAEYVGTALYKRGNIYQVTGRFGYFVTPFFMPYLRLGGQVSRDTVSYQVTGVVLSAPFVVTDFSSTKKDVWGAVGGIGAEFPTYIGSSTIRFEYNFVQTDRVTIRDSALPIIGVNQYHYPRTHVGKVAFVWNFL